MWKPSRFSKIAATQDHASNQQQHLIDDAVKVSSIDYRCCFIPSKSFLTHIACRTRSSVCDRFSAFKNLCTDRIAVFLRLSKRKARSIQHPRKDSSRSLPLVCSVKINAVSHILGPVLRDDQQCGDQTTSPTSVCLTVHSAPSSPTVLLIEKGKQQSYFCEEYWSSPISCEAELVANGDAVGRGTHLLSELPDVYIRFTLRDLKIATFNFSEHNVLGEGSSGSVYRGRLRSGLMVAVKVLRPGVKDAERGFITEIEIMRYVRHRHILPLLGYCVEDRHLILVYNHLRRGSLDSWLHGTRKSVLSWSARCKVAVGIAKALHYLHTGCKRSVIHRDVKASNILLSNDNSPKLSDFGLAIWAPPSFVTCKDIMGTFGYLAPEYFQYGRVSTKMDVYSFGILLLELMTGRRPIEREAPCGEENIAIWARHLICSGSGTEKLADPKLRGLYSPTRMRRMLCTAALCVHPIDSKRPSSSTVLNLMEKAKGGSMSMLLLEAYATFPSPTLDLTVANDHQQRSRVNKDDQRRRYLEMILADGEESIDEKSALLDGPCIL